VHETLKAKTETETLTKLSETRPWVGLETVSRPRRRDRDHIPTHHCRSPVSAVILAHVTPSTSVRNLGIFLDSEVSIKMHYVKRAVSSCFSCCGHRYRPIGLSYSGSEAAMPDFSQVAIKCPFIHLKTIPTFFTGLLQLVAIYNRSHK
jgi:hypothetical protein